MVDAFPGIAETEVYRKIQSCIEEGESTEIENEFKQNDGSGMSSEVLKRAFEYYFTTKPEGMGTGLGLSTAHTIITKAGGTIDIESEEGKGTTFHLWLKVIEN